MPEGAREEVLGYGIQGAIRGHVAELPAVKVGDFVFENVPAGFSGDSGGASADDSIIVGFPVLSRFNLTYDYRRERIFIEPNGRFDEPFGND